METGTPIITEMSVIPVAGLDSMLMTLSGAHACLLYTSRCV